MSTSTQSASARTAQTGPLVRMDGWVLGPMQSFGMGGPPPLGTFGVNAMGNPMATIFSWTGMSVTQGAFGSANVCSNWTDNTMNGTTGLPGSSDVGEWANQGGVFQCNRTYAIMCILR